VKRAGRLRALAVRLSGLFRPAARDGETAEELESHVQLHVDDYVRAGVDPREARRLALVKLGGVAQTREECRRRRGVPVIEDLWQDLRFGARVLFKQPGFTLAALLALALGIGANTAIFSVVNAVLLRALPYPDSDRLVSVEGVNAAKGITDSNMSAPDLADWQTQTRTFERVAGFVNGGALLNLGDEAERVRATSATADFFPLMRTSAALGRTLAAEDAQKKSPPVAVLSYALWQRRFGGDPSAVGRDLVISNESTTIVGVMPRGFDFPRQTEMWLPLSIDPAAERRDNRYVEVVARLRDGAALEEARAEMDAINGRLEQAYPETNSGWRVRLTSLRERLVGGMRTALLVLLGAVAFVLLIACANVANLLLARATSRRKEIAVRAALGASRLRVVRQLMTESVLLSLAGGTLGLLLSLWLTRLLVAVAPAGAPRFEEISVDARVFAFAFGVTILTGLLFGLAPALRASRVDLNGTLKEGGRAGAEGARRDRTRGLLVVSEIALSFMLLVGAGLLVRSFMRLREVSPGFDPAGVLAMRLSVPGAKYPAGAERAQFFGQALEKLRSLPGVESAGAVLSLPLGGDTFNVGRSFIREGRPATPEESQGASYVVATPGYFPTLRIPLKAGRVFDDRDTEKSPMVVVVNETMARKFWPGESPVGKRITVWRDEKFPREVVGVVGDTLASLDAPSGPQMYVPFAQDANWGGLSIVVRSPAAPSSLAPAARAAIHSLDSSLPVYNARPMEDVVAASVAERRASALLVSAFALVALALAATGILGVMSYTVTQRTHEIGIRLALGAQRGDILRLVVGRGLLLTAAGIVAGSAAALATTRLMASLLFEVSAADPATFGVIALLLTLVALLACYLPARRAAKVDPLVALRYE
jgi:putative ABC transport system permease protein